MKEPLFTLGTVTTTTFHAQMALEMSGESVDEFTERHVRGDFGEITEYEVEQNQKIINKKKKEIGDMIFSAYSLSFLFSTQIWIVTEFNSENTSTTTVLKYQEFELFFPKK